MRNGMSSSGQGESTAAWMTGSIPFLPVSVVPPTPSVLTAARRGVELRPDRALGYWGLALARVAAGQADRAVDAPHPAVGIEASAYRLGRGSGLDMADLTSWPDLSRNHTSLLAESLWRDAGLGPGDVDLAELKGLVLHLAASAGWLEALLGQLDSLSELVADAGPLLGDAVNLATVRLAELEAKDWDDVL